MRRSSPLLLLSLAAVSCQVGHSDERSAPRLGSQPAAAASPFAAAPDLRGIDSRGGAFSLAALRGDAIVLVFYRSDTCPLCRERLAALDANRQAYERAGARIVAITPDPPAVARRTAEALGLRMPVISVDRATLEHWGVWPAGEHAPKPAAVVLDREGRVRFRHLGRNAADRAGDIQILSVLDQIRAAAGRGAR